MQVKHEFISIPNKHKILPCMIQQFPEYWHKTLFNLGLQSSITPLVQISNLKYQGRYKLNRICQGS